MKGNMAVSVKNCAGSTALAVFGIIVATEAALTEKHVLDDLDAPGRSAVADVASVTYSDVEITAHAKRRLRRRPPASRRTAPCN